MYEYIYGTLAEVSPAEAIIEAGGVGYKILISLGTFSEIEHKGGQAVKLYLYHQVKEDDENLFGFYDKHERALFLLLISVSGVGAATACGILSALTAEELTEAIVTQDVGRIKKVKGIGLKTAQRLILELKDKLSAGAAGEFRFGEGGGKPDPVRDEACGALSMLGYQKAVAEKVVTAVLKENPGISVEEVIKRSLKML